MLGGLTWPSCGTGEPSHRVSQRAEEDPPAGPQMAEVSHEMCLQAREACAKCRHQSAVLNTVDASVNTLQSSPLHVRN
jgi:hypothetical protein